MIYYLTWQEDDWLDEIIDRFPGVNAMVPNGKNLERIKRERLAGELKRSVLVVNVAHEPEDTLACLERIKQDDMLGNEPLFLVGVQPQEQAVWQQRYPQAKVIAIDCHPFEFNYDAVLDQMQQELGDAS